jgi:hypothetical protein
VAMLFFENASLYFKNAYHFKDIFREYEAFLKISILFEDIFREIEAFLIKVRSFQRFLNTFLVKLRLLSDVMLLKKSEVFLKHLKRNGGFFQ